MRYFIYTSGLLFLSLLGFAQKDSLRKYLDADFRICSRKEAAYGAMAIRTGDHWVLIAVYPDTSILLKMTFQDADLQTKDGAFVIFHPKGLRAQSGNFTNNKLNGIWQTWYSNSQPKDSGVIANNCFSGIWKHWYSNGMLQRFETFSGGQSSETITAHDNSNLYTANKSLLEGPTTIAVHEGKSEGWYANGIKESETQFVKDTLNGQCVFYRENGVLSSKEKYAGGKLVDLECYDEKGLLTGSTCSVLKQPVFIHPFFTAQEYILDQLHRNKNEDISQEGNIKLSFIITAKGKLDNLIINSSPDAALSEHIRKIIAAMPPWSPAINHNRAIDFKIELTVPFFWNNGNY
jgi:antitoxin component YwqK of YwqJK toxin-antitoxin module